MRFFAVLLFLLLAATPAVAGELTAAGVSSPPKNAKALEQKDKQQEEQKEIARLIENLDSNRFETRRLAAERIEELITKVEWKQRLADEFVRVLVRADVSFEVRWRLERWLESLPPGRLDLPGEVSSEEIERLVRQLNATEYGARISAVRRLGWLLDNPHLAVSILGRLKRQLADESLDAETRRHMEALWLRARKAWLAGDAPEKDLPPVSDAQIEQWIDVLASPARNDAGHAQDIAEQELLDVLVRDAYVPRMVRLLGARLAGAADGEGVRRLQALLEWTKPEIAIEAWRSRALASVQRVTVGVPTTSRGATKMIHFDRIDDRSAHCISANSLQPGDLPVGTAIPHPYSTMYNYFFHIVNLSTPRRRMAYAEAGDEPKRLAALSRRTLDRVLADKKPMTLRELVLLQQLDPAELSRFAAKYFFLIDDGAVERTPDVRVRRLGGKPSRFGEICVCLGLEGTAEAVPGLLDAIAKKRFLPPSDASPYALPWIAAISIAARDPWPEVDAWLVDCMNRPDKLATAETPPPQLDATAAAVLLRRYECNPKEFGLQAAPVPLLSHMNVQGFYFPDEAAKKKTLAWWAQTKGKRVPVTPAKNSARPSTPAASPSSRTITVVPNAPMLIPPVQIGEDLFE